MSNCEKCDKPSNHEIGFLSGGVWKYRHLCCRHYVEEGGAPASWHPECLKAYADIKGLDREEYADEVERREAGIRALPRLNERRITPQ